MELIELREGQLKSDISPTSFEFGGMTSIEKTLLFEDGCLNYLPENELQLGIYFDTYGCASFSFLNALETVATRCLELGLYSDDNAKWLKDNYFVNGKINFSDRDLVVMSGTDPEWGNSSARVLESVQKNGLICESDDYFDFRNRDASINSKENYYNYQRTEKNWEKAREFLKRFDVQAEWVNRSQWKEASKYGVIQVYVRAWFRRENGLYYNPTPGRYGHGVMLASKSELKLFDHYDPFIKQTEKEEDIYIIGFKINLTEKIMEKPKLENNTLLQEVTQSGKFGLYLDGKILVGGAGEILATFYMRNNGDTKGKTKPLTLEQWNMFDKYNLKMEKI